MPRPETYVQLGRCAFFAIGILALFLLAQGCSKAPPAPKFGTTLPGEDFNVAILLIDTLRPDYLGCYGRSPSTTPIIDHLASEGVVFERAHTASTFTGEAVSALFTGRPPAMSRDGLGWAARPTPLEENLPKRFAAAGYRTGIFSTSFVMRFRGFFDSFQEAELFQGRPITSALDQELTDAALDFARKHQGERLFQYLHYYAPHAPYNPPADYLRSLNIDRGILQPDEHNDPAALASQGMTADDPRLAELRKHYTGEVSLIDREVARFMNGLSDLGLDKKTVVILLSDHGEEFMEHGFADHAWNLYEETLHIPLVIHAPALFTPGRVAEKVSIVDIMPTLLCCLRIPHETFAGPVAGQYLFAPGDSHWDFAGRPGPLYASLFPETRAQLHAVLFEDYKYITGPRWLAPDACARFWMLQGRLAEIARASGFLPMDPWAPVEHEALFDLGKDPGEHENLAGTRADLVERARVLLKRYQDASAPYRGEGPEATRQDPFNHAFIAEELKKLAVEANTPSQPGEDGERLSPEMIESLETMGYL